MLLLGASGEPHALDPLGATGEFVNRDIGTLQIDESPCVFVASAIPPKASAGAAYEIDVECFDLVGLNESKSRLYTTDSEGRLADRKAFLIGLYHQGDADYDVSAWEWVSAKLSSKLRARIAEEQQAKSQSGQASIPAPVLYQIRPGGEVSPPTLTHSVNPEFSPLARANHTQGRAVVALIVDTDGMPQHVHVITPIGYDLDESAISAVQHWRFKPALLHGQPVSVRIVVEVNFHIYQ